MAVDPSGQVPSSLKAVRAGWMIVGIVGIAAVLYFVLFPPRTNVSAHAPSQQAAAEPKATVEVQEDGTILISDETAFSRRLATVLLKSQRIADPLLTVSGIVVARVLAGEEELAERWHFDTQELASTHANWRKALSEVEFSRNILEKTRELAQAETAFREEQLRRLEQVEKSAGAARMSDILAARAELLKAQIQGQRDVFSAQSAVRVAENGRIALERELSQRGIEPVVFTRGVEHMVLISANVPEAKVSQVREGQRCRVRFYAYPEKLFDAHVETLSTTVTRELRTLRVLFDLNDPEGVLIPGMFAEVALGTDEREALVVPAAAILHVGQSDYVLVETPFSRCCPAFRPDKRSSAKARCC
jgi:cobalt-zinc-cadmium efflux system membrane fusion protein